ncbi:MAG: lipopolysaccharide transport periplasmic protein LptA [Burkholderiaceae bacterium]|nr:lipopolysaccharide transport periplasmic protein LptA [Burkholderiaceae bacterium]
MPDEIFLALMPFCARWHVRRAVVCALAALAAWGVPAAWAEKADREQPMHIEADAMRYEGTKNGQPQTATFTGHVVVTKGTILMRGDQLVVHQDAQGNQSGVMTPAPGERAFFHQKRDGVNEYIQGEADRMEYDGKADTVHLIGNAEMWRLTGATMIDNVTGDVIVYNDNTEVYTVDRAAAPAAGGKPGRVRAIMVPQNTASAAKPSTGAKPNQPAVPLRAASALPPPIALVPAPASAPAPAASDAGGQP